MFLLSVMPKRTWIGFRNFADSVLDQRHAKKHLSRFQKFSRLCSCTASCQNALRLFSVILPILFLLSVMPKRTWVGFRNFADSVLDQRHAKTHLGRFQKFSQLCSCTASCQNALRLFSVILPILFLLNV